MESHMLILLYSYDFLLFPNMATNCPQRSNNSLSFFSKVRGKTAGGNFQRLCHKNNRRGRKINAKYSCSFIRGEDSSSTQHLHLFQIGSFTKGKMK